MTISEISQQLADSSNRMPALHAGLREKLKSIRAKHDAILAMQGQIRGLVRDLSISAADADVEAMTDGLAKLQTLKGRVSKAETDLDAFLEGTEAYLSPVADVLNAAIALEPLLAIVKANWFDLPPEVTKAIAEKCKNIQWN